MSEPSLRQGDRTRAGEKPSGMDIEPAARPGPDQHTGWGAQRERRTAGARSSTPVERAIAWVRAGDGIGRQSTTTVGRTSSRKAASRMGP